MAVFPVVAARRRSALTIAELGAVIAATALVIALALSAYTTYQVRREVGEGILVGSDLIADVTAHYRRHGEVPATLDASWAHGTVGASPFVASVAITNGRIDVLYGNSADPAIAGRHVSLTPYETADRQVVWICGNAPPGPGLEPLGFAGGGRQAEHEPSSVDARYLSRHCR